jgi:hypothetical protein
LKAAEYRAAIARNTISKSAKGIDRTNGGMNRLESRYAAVLDARKSAGEIRNYWWDCINLRIGANCFYRTDFLVMASDCTLELHETKGFMRDDALVKLKIVADKFPFRVYVVRWVENEWEMRDMSNTERIKK